MWWCYGLVEVCLVYLIEGQGIVEFNKLKEFGIIFCWSMNDEKTTFSCVENEFKTKVLMVQKIGKDGWFIF
jgi:hypothetical protein